MSPANDQNRKALAGATVFAGVVVVCVSAVSLTAGPQQQVASLYQTGVAQPTLGAAKAGTPADVKVATAAAAQAQEQAQAAPGASSGILVSLGMGLGALAMAAGAWATSKAKKAVHPLADLEAPRYGMMATEGEKVNPGKAVGAALLGASLMASPVMAVDGAAPKQSFFGNGASSPFVMDEGREDKIYSPYSPYGNGEAAAYNTRKGGKEEIAFWSKTFAECKNRVAKVPAAAQKKTWYDIDSTMRTYAYNMRESMNRLAKASKDPAAASAAAKTYFQDLNDISEWSAKKDGAKVMAAYDKSTADLKAYENLLK